VTHGSAGSSEARVRTRHPKPGALVRRPSFGEWIELKPDEFRLLRDLFAVRTGLHFGPESRFSVERRLRERLVVLNMATFAEYHHYLRYGSHAQEEWDEAIELLTTNETYFFREERQLHAFETEVLPLVQPQAKARGRLTVWSAGCSTGEEVYTIAILIQQSGLFPPAGPHQVGRASAFACDVRVYGSDISRRCVAAARRGVYAEGSFRATTPQVRAAFFRRDGDGWQVADSIRQVCHFGQMNLLDEDRSRILGRADVVFCRNVLIYLDARARKTVIEVLYDRLHPGGILLLGHSESLLNVSTAFELLHLRDDLVYRKPVSARGPNQVPGDTSS